MNDSGACHDDDDALQWFAPTTTALASGAAAAVRESHTTHTAAASSCSVVGGGRGAFVTGFGVPLSQMMPVPVPVPHPNEPFLELDGRRRNTNISNCHEDPVDGSQKRTVAPKQQNHHHAHAHHRKRHVPVGPAGAWFQAQQQHQQHHSRGPTCTTTTTTTTTTAAAAAAAFSDDPEDDTNTHEEEDGIRRRRRSNPPSTTTTAALSSSVFVSPAWTAAHCALRLATPSCPAHWSRAQKSAVLQPYYNINTNSNTNIKNSMSLLLLSDILNGVADWKMKQQQSPKKLLVQVVAVHTSSGRTTDRWTVTLQDEAGTTMPAWMQPALVQAEQQHHHPHAKYIRIGHVWLLSACTIQLVEKNSTSTAAAFRGSETNNEDDDDNNNNPNGHGDTNQRTTPNEDDRGMDRMLLVSESNIEQVWSDTTPTTAHEQQQHPISNAEYIQWMETRNTLTTALMKKTNTTPNASTRQMPSSTSRLRPHAATPSSSAGRRGGFGVEMHAGRDDDETDGSIGDDMEATAVGMPVQPCALQALPWPRTQPPQSQHHQKHQQNRRQTHASSHTQQTCRPLAPSGQPISNEAQEREAEICNFPLSGQQQDRSKSRLKSAVHSESQGIHSRRSTPIARLESTPLAGAASDAADDASNDMPTEIGHRFSAFAATAAHSNCATSSTTTLPPRNAVDDRTNNPKPNGNQEHELNIVSLDRNNVDILNSRNSPAPAKIERAIGVRRPMPSNLFSAENAAMIELFDDDDDDGEKTSDLENKSPLISRAGAVSAVAPLSEQDFLHAEKDNKIQDIVCVTLEEPSGMENGPCTAPSSKPNLFESSAFASFDMDSMFGEDDEL